MRLRCLTHLLLGLALLAWTGVNGATSKCSELPEVEVRDGSIVVVEHVLASYDTHDASNGLENGVEGVELRVSGPLETNPHSVETSGLYGYDSEVVAEISDRLFPTNDSCMNATERCHKLYANDCSEKLPASYHYQDTNGRYNHTVKSTTQTPFRETCYDGDAGLQPITPKSEVTTEYGRTWPRCACETFGAKMPSVYVEASREELLQISFGKEQEMLELAEPICVALYHGDETGSGSWWRANGSGLLLQNDTNPGKGSGDGSLLIRLTFSSLHAMKTLLPGLPLRAGLTPRQRAIEYAKRYKLKRPFKLVDLDWLRERGVVWPILKNADEHSCSLNVGVAAFRSFGSFFRVVVRESMTAALSGHDYSTYNTLGELRYLLRNNAVEKDTTRLRELLLPDEPANTDVKVVDVLEAVIDLLSEPHQKRWRFNVDSLLECPKCHEMVRANTGVEKVYFWAKQNTDYTMRHSKWQEELSFGDPKSWEASFKEVGYSPNQNHLRVCSICKDCPGGLNLPSDETGPLCETKSRLTDPASRDLPRYLFVFPYVKLPEEKQPNSHAANKAALKKLRVTPRPTELYHDYWEYDKSSKKEKSYNYNTKHAIKYRLTGYSLFALDDFDHVVWRTPVRNDAGEETAFLHVDDSDTYEVHKDDYYQPEQPIQFLAYEAVSDSASAYEEQTDDENSDEVMEAMEVAVPE